MAPPVIGELDWEKVFCESEARVQLAMNHTKSNNAFQIAFLIYQCE